jgi:hypothetical protein
MRDSTILFIGCSMTDPDIRRFLTATRDGSGAIRHFVLRKQLSFTPQEESEIALKIGQRAATYNPTLTKTPTELAKALSKAVVQAQSYDKQVLESLGVGAVLFKSYDDIPELLARVTS